MTFQPTYEDFFKQSGEFFRMANQPNVTREQIENRAKAITLMYLGIKGELTPAQEVSAQDIIHSVSKKESEFDPIMQVVWVRWKAFKNF